MSRLHNHNWTEISSFKENFNTILMRFSFDSKRFDLLPIAILGKCSELSKLELKIL